MKVYLHCEDPVVTMVIVWPDDKTGTIGDILDIFSKKLLNTHKQLTADDIGTLTVSNSKGKNIEPSCLIKKTVKHMDDIFVKRNPPKSEIRSDSEPRATKGQKTDKAEGDEEDKDEDQSAAMLNAATVHIGNQRYRKAIMIYKDILKSQPGCKKALTGLVRCFLQADRAKDAFKYVKTGLKIYKDDVEFLLLGGQCLVALEDGDTAIEYLMKYCKLSKQQGGTSRNNKNDVQVLIAKAYLIKDQKDMAITILQGVLRDDLNHHDALIEFASLIYPLGSAQAEEAMGVMLTVLAKGHTDKYTLKKFAGLCTQPDGMNILKSVASKAMKDSKALAFLATCLRDCSAVTEALDLQEMAMEADQGNPSIALAYLHNLELLDKHREIVTFVKGYVNTYPEKGIGPLTCSLFKPYISLITDDLQILSDATVLEPQQVDAPSRVYTEEEKQLLAFWFTVTKVLYIKGLLRILPPVLQLLRPLCKGRKLHECNIRNEAAYFTCIDEVSALHKKIPDPMEDSTKFLYFIGDSHCVPAAWNTVKIQNDTFMLHPILATGTKIWHLRPEGTFYPRVNFFSAIKNIPDGSMVTICLGEIDCREAFLKCWEKARYDTIEDAMERVALIYIKLLRGLKKQHNWSIYIHPVLPVIDITRPIVMQFNRILASKLVGEPSLHWLNFVNDLLTPDGGDLKEELKFDGTHIHPDYLSLFSEAFDEHTTHS